MKKCLIFSFFVFTSVFALAQLRINEIMSNNVSAVMDEYYNYRMWVELYNMGEIEEDQNAYYFTDDLSQPKQWKPLSKEIPAKGFSVLWFERPGEENEEAVGIEYPTEGFYSSFKLDPDGGTLYLLDESGNIVDQLDYPAQYRNVSYGRLVDGENIWVLFVEYSIGASNNGRKYADAVCKDPIFALTGGFYQGSVDISFEALVDNETIYYTTDGSEPNINSFVYILGNPIHFTKTTCIRAISIAENKIPSKVVTTTYFINERDFNLPVVSIVTDPKNLFDDEIGIYVEGTNGVYFRYANKPVNYARDWFRPANFELFDTVEQRVLGQELDITITGGLTRTYAQKSLKIKPRKKFGDNQLHYDFFSAQKPNQKYKDILLRHSGNDWMLSMMRDGFMQTLITNRMNVDFQAYEPAVLFINGEYYGIQNLREVHSANYFYSNYGLNKEDIFLLDRNDITTHPEFVKLSNFILQNDMTQFNVYKQVEQMMDVNSYAEYFLSEIYFCNTDWPGNNIVIWKSTNGGKWRWMLYDTDFGFRLSQDESYNVFTRVLDVYSQNNSHYLTIYNGLMKSNVFRNKFLYKFCIHLSSTFVPSRVDSIMDKLASRISMEIVYHKDRWEHQQNFDNQITRMKIFSKGRPDYVYQHIGERFFPTTETQIIKITSNISKAKYQFFTEPIIDHKIDLRYFKDQPVVITPAHVPGYKFSHWEYSTEDDGNVQILTDPEYNGVLTQNISLKAIYEKRETNAPLKIYVNEINGNDKWLEIFNDEDEPVHLTGFTIQKFDNEGEITSWPIPPGTIIDAKGFKVFTQGIDAQKDVAFKLFDDEGRELDVFEVKMQDNLYSLGNNRTVGRQTDGDPNLIVFLNGGTKGCSNNDGTPETRGEGAGKRIFINEISGNDKWLEIYNDEEEIVDMTGYTIRRIDDVNKATDWSIPAGTTIPAKGFKVWTQNEPNSFTWGITAQRDVSFKLFDNEWRELDFFEVRMSDHLYSDGGKRTVGRQTDGHPNLIIFLNGGTKGYSNRWVIPEIPWDVIDDDDTFSDLNIYPNPFTGELYVVGGEGCILTVISVSGAVVHLQRIANPDEIIHLEHLPSGMYIFRVVEKDGKVKTVKTIKN